MKERTYKYNREHKDRLFRYLFSREENKEKLLELYNALNDTNYTDVDELEITTLEDVIYMGVKNDVSLLLHSRMALYEQQSTYNPNMPLRGLLYYARLYEKYIEKHKMNIYGKKTVPLPMPQYIVFYNGEDEYEDETILRLSDAFQGEGDKRGYEWTAKMLNINYGHNKELMKKCRALYEYVLFVHKVKEYIKEEVSEIDAIERAVKECIQEGVLDEFLRVHRAEVIDVLLTEYDQEKVLNAIREEEREFGREQGIELGREQGIELGREQGIELGREQGIEQGIERGVRKSLQMALDFGCSMDEAIAKTAELYQMEPDEVERIWDAAMEQDMVKK